MKNINGFRNQEQTQQEGRQGQEELGENGRIIAETYPNSGGHRLQRLVRIENISNDPGTLVILAATAEEIMEEVKKHIPQLKNAPIGYAVSDSRQGTSRRRFLKGDLPDDIQDIYIHLYLIRH
jgi:hypothetical protein